MVPPPVAFRQVLGGDDGAGQHAPPERRIGHEPNPQLAADRQDVVFHKAAPQRIFGLQRRYRMHLVRPPDGVDARLRKSQEADLALLHQLFHRPDRVLDRHVRIDTVLVVEVDGLDPQPLKALFAGLDHIFGPAIDPEPAVRRALVAELGGDHRPCPIAAGERPFQQLLVGAEAIHVRRVQEVRPPVQRLVHRGDGLVLVDRTVERGHGHATESEG